MEGKIVEKNITKLTAGDNIVVIKSSELCVNNFCSAESLDKIGYEYDSESFDDREYEDVINDEEDGSDRKGLLSDVLRDAIRYYWDEGEYHHAFENRVLKIKNVYVKVAENRLLTIQDLIDVGPEIFDMNYICEIDDIGIFVETSEPFDFEFHSDFNLMKFSAITDAYITVFGKHGNQWVRQEYNEGNYEEGYFSDDKDELYIISDLDEHPFLSSLIA